ncbi:uncharacterized protein AFUA_2G06260 [Aspergillus fumigatus Af293]|uniref:Uncharacterized protein n=2 Tax=Aspergillus fumigatus TaxID=746128 RepID=Q4WH88_ASPFU|nr:hypothetical protein AFUA_2G06260 [Aspergillus fumigatus Af293]EAL87717.1 hypothetical protein AFUA_2G06260 [Aspergillus fumigatus Af293]EDP54278.1 hypothetical protein AFUB_023340 [Aspergillus fumigatus A1163]
MHEDLILQRVIPSVEANKVRFPRFLRKGTQSASTGIAEELPNVGLNIWGKEVALYGRNAFGGLSWDYVYAQNSTVWLSSSRCHLTDGPVLWNIVTFCMGFDISVWGA